jgi:uncharacterized membrane protein
MIRKKAATLIDSEQGIRWRSHEPSRLETFSDAVFAFSLTLVIVSLEVPKSFNELYETMKGTASFAICFIVLFMIWNQQNLFFRRYGMKGAYITTLNACLLFMVMIYAYPLKFLFFLMFSSNVYMLNGHPHPMIYASQQPTLMLIYGTGFTVIYILFFLMYLYAEKKGELLELKPYELFITRTVKWANFILIIIGLMAITLAYILPAADSGNSGLIYILIPITHTFWFTYRGRKTRRLYKISD